MVKQIDIQKNQWQERWESSTNNMKLTFPPLSENEGFARVAVAAFVVQLDPVLEEVEDIKTAVSEAVTNSIIHGYENMHKKGKNIELEACMYEGKVHIKIRDYGVGIENIHQAMEPLFTTKPELERSGMGFAFMEAFMDELQVESSLGKGTTVYMSKQIGGQ